MRDILFHFRNHSYQQVAVCLVLICASLAVLFFSFVSCDSPIDINFPSTEADDEEEEDDDEEDYEECRGFEACEDVCELIYNESWQECSELDSDEVNELQRIHSRLKSSNDPIQAKLIEISEEKNEVDLNAFEEYLHIGIDGWLKQIDGYDTKEGNNVAGYSQSQAQEVLHWLAEEKKVAETLADEEGGSRVLEALLNRVSGSTCWDSGSKIAGGVTFELDSTSRNIRVSNSVLTVTVQIDSDTHFDLYKKLSCPDVDESGSGLDIFSLAAYEDNRYLFDMAFDLVDDVCQDSNLISGEEEKEDICRRALMCALAIGQEPGDLSRWDGWGTGSNSYGAKDRFKLRGFDKGQACDLNNREFGGNIDINP